MKPRLDLQKSIAKQRLVYRMTTSFFFTWLLNNSRWLILSTLPVLIAFNPRNQIGLLLLFISGIFTITLALGLYFINNVVVLKGLDMQDNRERILEFVRKKFPNFKIDNSGQNVIHCKKNAGFYSWGQEITIIFDDTNLLINLSTLGRHEVRSPFHSIFNYIKMKQLLNNFNRVKSS